MCASKKHKKSARLTEARKMRYLYRIYGAAASTALYFVLFKIYGTQNSPAFKGDRGVCSNVSIKSFFFLRAYPEFLVIIFVNSVL